MNPCTFHGVQYTTAMYVHVYTQSQYLFIPTFPSPPPHTHTHTHTQTEEDDFDSESYMGSQGIPDDIPEYRQVRVSPALELMKYVTTLHMRVVQQEHSPCGFTAEEGMSPTCKGKVSSATWSFSAWGLFRLSLVPRSTLS